MTVVTNEHGQQNMFANEPTMYITEKDKFGICRNRDPKKYNKNKKEERNIQLIEDYKSRKYSIEELSLKYNMSTTNIYRIFKNWNNNKK
jgi:hypothetical protein